MTGGSLPGAPGSPLQERSNLIDASAGDDVGKKRRPNALSPLGGKKPELPQMLDGGLSPRTPSPQPDGAGAGAGGVSVSVNSPTGTPSRTRRRDFGTGASLRSSLGSPRTSASLTKQQTSAWASSKDLSDLGGGQGVVQHGSLVVTIRTSAAGPETPAPGTDAQVWCTLYGAEGKSDEMLLPRHSIHDFGAGHVGKFPTKVNIKQLGGKVEAVAIRHDGAGSESAWHVDNVTVEDPDSGHVWEFECGEWLSSEAPGGASRKLDLSVSYTVLEYKKALGRVAVGASGTEVRLCSMNFTPLETVDGWISALILFSLLIDIVREEYIRPCIEEDDGWRTEVAAGAGSLSGGTPCTWADTAKVIYPTTLVVDFLVLLIFFTELLGRFMLKYWGMRNMFAYTLRNYNRRYRKMGLEAFRKNCRSAEWPWFRTISAANFKNAQLRKEYEDNRNAEDHQQQKIPYNFLQDEYLLVVIFEFVVVAVSMIVQATYFIASYSMLGQPGLPDEGWLEMLRHIASILRILRIARIVTRVKKLRSLTSSLIKAFSGVLWIFVLVFVGTYAFAIVGVMSFKIDPTNPVDLDLIDSSQCDEECVQSLYSMWGSLGSAARTLCFNVMLQDDLNSMMDVTTKGPAGSWTYVYVVTYLLLVVFLLMEAITGYIVEIISTRYSQSTQMDNMPFAAVARIQVKEWFEELQGAPEGKETFKSKTGLARPEPAWLREIAQDIDIRNPEHVHRMLNRIRKIYDLDFAQMETPPEQSVLHSADPRFPPSDWLIGVRSEAQLAHLLECGFTYISADDEDCVGVQEDIVIPVVRENQGELVQFTGIRPPLFATEDDIRASFEEYGIVMEVERENFDLPEDQERPDEVATLEETMTMSWKIRIYRNEKHFDTMPVDDFPAYSQRQLELCRPGELPYIDGYQSCHCIEIYGTPVPLRPATTFYLNRKERKQVALTVPGSGSGGGVRGSMASLLGTSIDSTAGGGVGGPPSAQQIGFTPKKDRQPLRDSSKPLTLGLSSSSSPAAGGGGGAQLDAGSASVVEGMAAGLEAQLAAMASSFPGLAGKSAEERAAVLAELGRRAHEAIERAVTVSTVPPKPSPAR